jgi:hypothetical protein
MTVNTRIFYIIIFSSFIFLGCNNPFAPRLAGKDTPTSKLLTEQKTPSEVLSNFEYAYTFKDSLIYSDLLDNSFIFRSINYYNDPPEPIHWGRDLELRTTGKMLRYFNTILTQFPHPIHHSTLQDILLSITLHLLLPLMVASLYNQ